MPLFKREKTLTEKQDEDDSLDTDVSIARKRALLAQLNARAGSGSWKMFSSNNKKSGISWNRVWAWLRTH